MKNKVLSALLTLSLTFGVASSYAEYVTAVHDGDTFTVITRISPDPRAGYRYLSIRISGIDAPELAQPEGPMSRDNLMKLIYHKNVELEIVGKSYNRYVAFVRVDDEDVGAKMVKLGAAYNYQKYSHGTYITDEIWAKLRHNGVWSIPESLRVKPWDYRNAHRQITAQQRVYTLKARPVRDLNDPPVKR